MAQIGQLYRKHHGIDGEYDSVVVGSGMGGMTVASILARYGKRVLLLEQNNIIGGLTQSYSRAGYTWNTGLHYIGDVESQSKLTRRLFDYLSDGKLEWAPLPAIFNRMVIGGRSYAIPAGEVAYREALVEWFPDDVDGIDRYLADIGSVSRAARMHFGQKALPESFVTENWEEMNRAFHAYSDLTTAEALGRYTDNDELIAVLCANWGDYSAPPSSSSYAMHCMLNQHYMDGGSYPIGGASRLAETLLPIVEENGGAVVRGAHVEEILVRDGRSVGVRLISGETVECDQIISNAGVQNTFGRLMGPPGQSILNSAERVSEVVDTYALVGINIGLKGSADDLGLDPANIWAHPSSDMDANLSRHKASFDAPFPWSFITFPSAKDPSWEERHPGKATIEMYAYTYFEHFAEWAGTSWRKRGNAYEARKLDIQRRLLTQLGEFFPEISSAVDVVEVSTPLTYETFVCRARGGFMGIESNPARFRQSWLRSSTDIQGLYLTGQDVTTDGVIGALMGGIIASSAVLERDVLSDIRQATKPASSNQDG